jgi:hypothetical protein
VHKALGSILSTAGGKERQTGRQQEAFREWTPTLDKVLIIYPRLIELFLKKQKDKL